MVTLELVSQHDGLGNEGEHEHDAWPATIDEHERRRYDLANSEAPTVAAADEMHYVS